MKNTYISISIDATRIALAGLSHSLIDEAIESFAAEEAELSASLIDMEAGTFRPTFAK